MPVRKPFVAGNWKMNTDTRSGPALASGIAEGCKGLAGRHLDVALCPPFVYLQLIFRALAASSVALAAQDLYVEQKGAFTGEISAAMLKDAGCTYVLCGHSERRHVIGETDELVGRKAAAAIAGGLLPIVCAGELLEQRQASKTKDTVRRQVERALDGLSAGKLGAVTIAYEPVWAIGTGHNATPQQAQEVHAFIRQLVAGAYGPGEASQMRILYGGSVKPGNTAELMKEPDIDGLLVGGASLDAGSFMQIIRAAKDAKGLTAGD
jgi:triosephosphate isomerase